MTIPMDRRGFLKTAAAGTLGLAAPFIIRPGTARSAPTELTMLAWYGHAEPEVVGEFEEQHNVKIRKKYYVGGDQMLALITQSPPGTYDIILSDREYVEQLLLAGLVDKLDPRDYPFDDMFAEFQQLTGLWSGADLFAVPLRFGYLGISYNRDLLSEAEASTYAVLWDERLKGKIGHFDWYLPNLGTISLYDGHPSPFDLGDDQWEKTRDTLFSLRPQVGGFFDYGGVLSSLRSGQVAAIPGIGDWITGVLQRDGANVATAIPEEGGLMWSEALSIGLGSRQPELAKSFIQYMLSPAGQIRTATLEAYPALLPTKSGWKALQEERPDEAERQKMILDASDNALSLLRAGRIKPRALPVQQPIETWNDAWSRYKTS